MKIMELARQLHSLDSEKTIYAKKPWTCESEVQLLIEPEDGSLPSELSDGFEYFLEIFIALDVIPNLLHVEPSFTLEQWSERLIEYADNDA
jgi:hypothetical protein